MNIVIHGYNTCCINQQGGVQLRIKKIASLLVERGYDVSLFSPFETDLSKTDVLHIFQLNSENYNLIKCAKARGIKVVISSIVQLNRGKTLDFYRKVIDRLHIFSYYKLIFESARMADHIIAETFAEKRFLIKHYGVDESKISVVPNGIDETEYCGGEIFDSVFGLKKQYALCVGRFDENKNQLSVIRALKNSNIDVVFIGGADHSKPDYYDKCIEEARGHNNLHFLGWVDNGSNILKSAYSNAEVFIFPSFHETFGLVLLEAGIAAKKLCVSKSLPILEYKCFDGCLQFDPGNVAEIRDCVIGAFKTKADDGLKQRILNTFSWENVIDCHAKIYNSLVAKGNERNNFL